MGAKVIGNVEGKIHDSDEMNLNEEAQLVKDITDLDEKKSLTQTEQTIMFEKSQKLKAIRASKN